MPNTNMTYPNTIYTHTLIILLSAILIYYLKSTRKKQRKYNNYLHLLSFNAIIMLTVVTVDHLFCASTGILTKAFQYWRTEKWLPL